MDEEHSYVYQYVTIPGNESYVTVENVEMINILAPVVKSEDKNSTYNSQIIEETIKYETIVTTDELMTNNIKTEDQTTNSYSMHKSLKRLEQLRKDSARKKLALLRETAEQRTVRLNKDRTRKRLARQNETDEQRERRLERDRERIRRRRALETDGKRLEKGCLSKRVKENGTSSASSSPREY